MGNQSRPGVPHWSCHTAVSIWQDRSTTYTGRLHAHAYSTALTTSVSHGHVPASPSIVLFRKCHF
ncbi:LPS-assembly lptD [Gossypium arboreum]|uniref:LPS-assembly lptD n=1 Tax=Gossypium arboreum TaxID=29729 RepID=A0A0B0P6C7_GOSAR|nr:LPS-assembly lptD [Gossypium arboreum]